MFDRDQRPHSIKSKMLNTLRSIIILHKTKKKNTNPISGKRPSILRHIIISEKLNYVDRIESLLEPPPSTSLGLLVWLTWYMQQFHFSEAKKVLEVVSCPLQRREVLCKQQTPAGPARVPVPSSTPG
jgi:hypothetical protein